MTWVSPPASSTRCRSSDGGSALEIVDGDLVFPECPRWHDGRLWLSDMAAGRVLAHDPATGTTEVVHDAVEGEPGGLGWDADGRLLVVSMQGRQLLAEEDGALVPVADLGAEPVSCNDMVVDRAGRAYVGGFGFDLWARAAESGGAGARAAEGGGAGARAAESGGTGARAAEGGGTAARAERRETVLQVVQPDGSVEIAAEGLSFPNGMVLTDDGLTLVVAESFGGRLTAFDVDPMTGALTGRRTWAELDGIGPDGICLDEEDAIWVASPATEELVRVREGGEVTRRIPTPDRWAVACALGGADRRTLYCCTAVVDRAAGERRSGALEAIEVEVAGAGLP